MGESDPALEEAAEAVRTETLELLPLVRKVHGKIGAWDAERLVVMREVFLAHCRDGLVRLLGVKPVPAEAGLAWWRAVADQADAQIATFADPRETAKLWLSLGDDLAIRCFIIMRLSLVLAEEERRRRRGQSAVGRIMWRTLFSEFDEADRRELVEELGHPRPLGLDERGDVENESLAAVWAFYRKLEEMARPLVTPAADLAPVALGLLEAHRSAPAGWAHVAGELLHEDIAAAAELWLPFLTPDLDERARQAAWDAWRARYREGFADFRGGPGFHWACACEGVTHLWNVPRCAVCLQERPPKAPHVELTERAVPLPEHDDRRSTDLEARARVMLFIEAIKRHHGDSKACRAFEAMVKEALDTGHFPPRSVVAQEHGVPESTLRAFLDKLGKYLS